MERDMRDIVLSALKRVAPDVDLTRARDDIDLRDQFELDSMDFLTFVEVLHEATGVDIPERDYPKLATIAASVNYLSARHTPRGIR